MTYRPHAAILAAVTMLAAVGCSDTVRPRFVNSISLEPDSVFLRPGEQAVFQGRARDPRDEDLPDAPPFIRWRSVRPDLATVSDTVGASITVQAIEVGSAEIEAELGRGSASAFVHVTPPGEIGVEIVSPQDAFEVGRGMRLRVVLTRPNGDTVDAVGYRMSWQAGPEGVLFVNSSVATGPEVFAFAQGPGTGRVTVIVSDFRATREFPVRP